MATTYLKIRISNLFFLVFMLSLNISKAQTTSNFCPGALQAQISAPSGYSSYQWFEPNSFNQPIVMSPQSGGNTSLVTISNPTAGIVYTVQLTASNGFSIAVTHTLQNTFVSILSTNSFSTCPGTSNGSALVNASGSGTGYTYSWLNSGNNSVGSTSVASNLAAGVYSINITAIGAAACGSAVATVTVNTTAINVSTVVTAFCNSPLVLNSPSGTNRQWYNGTTSLTALQNGTSASITVTSPVTGQFYWLSYTNSLACRDSLNYYLIQATPGSLSITNVSYACSNLTNAKAEFTLVPSNSGLPVVPSFSVFSTSGPAYSSSMTNIPVNSYTALNMPAGTYSVIASDGLCRYTSTFVVSTYTFSFQLPANPTVCIGSSVFLGPTFSSPIVPNQYTFTWSPIADINLGSINANNIVIMVNPASISSPNTITYSVTITPSVVNCPLTQTVSVTSVQTPVTPIITSALQPFCSNAISRTITANPAGGTFTTGSGNWLGNTSGIITPSLTSPGTNTYTYSKGIGNCVSSVTGSFITSKFNTAALTSSVLSYCNNNSNCVNLLSVSQNSNGIWSGTGVSGNLFCPLSMPQGSYNLLYTNVSTPNPMLCPDSRNLIIEVKSSSLSGTVIPAPFCSNATAFNMTVNASGGNWSSPIPSFVSSAGLVNPAFSPGGTTTLVYTGYCGNTTSVNVTSAIFRSAALTSPIPELCKTSPTVNLMSIVSNTVGGNWTGTGVTASVFTPSVGPGSYTLQYNTVSSNPPLCPDQSALVVKVYNTPSVTVTGNQRICNTQITNLVAFGANSYDINGNSTSSIIAVAPTVNTSYTITGTSGTCKSIVTINILVEPCTSINSLNIKAASINIYPNPTNGNITLDLHADAQISVFNNLGQLIIDAELSAGNKVIDLSTFKAGVYQLSVKSGDKTSFARIIKTD